MGRGGSKPLKILNLASSPTFGFRMPHEGPVSLHYDLAGYLEMVPRIYAREDEGDPNHPPTKLLRKLVRRMAEGKPWFVDPNRF